MNWMEQNIQEMNKRFEAKKREEILNQIPVKFHNQVNEALDYEQEDDYEKTAELCQDILATKEGHGNEQVKIILARVFPSVLRMDVETENKKYQQHLSQYYTFLDGIEMNELMQEYIVETLIKLCELMENDWYRPLFWEFVEHIERQGYLTEEVYKETLASAYASLESYDYYGDSKVSMLAKTVMKLGYDKAYTIRNVALESMKNRLNLDVLMNAWYLTQYYEEHEEEFSYIAQKYPYSYRLITDLVKDIKTDVHKKEESLLEELMNHVTEGTTKEQLMDVLTKSYADLMAKEAKPQTVYAGRGSYRRSSEKIGRNEPCPCGSGKKYKHCCGK